MLFLNADFWPLFWAVIGGGAGLTAVLSLFASTAQRPHRAPAFLPVETAATRAHERDHEPVPHRDHEPVPHRDHEPVHTARAA
jgi:hypothetical protein